MDKKERPIKKVEITNKDFKEPRKPSGSNKLFGKVTEETRRKLADELKLAELFFEKQFYKWPTIPAVLKISLKEEALAKSHRPIALLRETTCPIIGTMDFGELLVSLSLSSVNKFLNEILNTKSQKKIANISAIEKIEPYSLVTNKDVGDSDWLTEQCKEGTPLKVKIFDHSNEIINQKIENILFQIADELDVVIKKELYGERRAIYKVHTESKAAVEELQNFIGVQSCTPMPIFKPVDFDVQSTPVGNIDKNMLPQPVEGESYPVVGVIDSGVCRNCKYLEPWVVGRETYIPESEQDKTHGTMVAGMIAGCYTLNNKDPKFPKVNAKVLDVPVFSNKELLSEDTLVNILEDVVPKHPEIKIWNLSLAALTPVSESEFSDFACFLDEMHDKHRCLFVVASGNHSLLQEWPHKIDSQGLDRVASPGDSTRALTVGSIANKHVITSLSKTDEPSPFSRRGPGPCYIPKPEVSHYGGNCGQKFAFAQTGVLSTGPNNTLCETIGTSFATPIVSAQAASLWRYLEEETQSKVSPEKVKALLIHSALINGSGVSHETLNYSGFGQPAEIVDTLYCDSHAVTFLFETDLKHGGFEFERWPFPVAESMYNDEKKFVGEVLMTVVYSPLTDANFKSEYCRTNVDVGLGEIYSEVDLETGEEINKFRGKIPPAPKDVNKLYEKYQLENGFKWSPVKAYRARFPKGVGVDKWRLRMQVYRRAEIEKPDDPQPATLLVTFRSLDPSHQVYNEAIIAATQYGWVLNDIDATVRIDTTT